MENDKMQARIKSLLEHLKNGKRNICYGAGLYGQQLLGFLRAHQCNIDYFVVSRVACKDETLFGIPVRNIDDIMDVHTYNWIISTSRKYFAQINTILESKSINPCFAMEDDDLEDILIDALQRNEEVHNIISDKKRCFIMGTGGSIRLQNLKLLHDEDVFSCSYCSLLDDYEQINPKYYIVPALTNDPISSDMQNTYIREEIAFKTKTVKSSMIFCDYKDRNYIQYYEGFKDKKIYYLNQEEKWNEKEKKIYDLSKRTPTIQTGSIMMLKIAMYMGYKKIYLIGTEHDLVTHKYDHAYELVNLKKYGFDGLFNIAASQNNHIEKRSNREILSMSLNMYNEYYYLHNIAKQNGIEIYNATEGGSLDEFDRVEFSTLFE